MYASPQHVSHYTTRHVDDECQHPPKEVLHGSQRPGKQPSMHKNHHSHMSTGHTFTKTTVVVCMGFHVPQLQ